MILSWADELSSGHAEGLRAEVARCRPLHPPRPFFLVLREMPSVAEHVQRDAETRFAVWGLWHNGDVAKPEAVRPARYIVTRAPELRLRSLVDPTI